MNGDGRRDLVVTNQNSNTISFLLGQGNGMFAMPINSAVGTNPFHTAIGDLNGDGLPDVAGTNADSNTTRSSSRRLGDRWRCATRWCCHRWRHSAS